MKDLIKHARNELTLAGYDENHATYVNVMRMVESLSNDKESMNILKNLLFGNGLLTPLTLEDNEWLPEENGIQVNSRSERIIMKASEDAIFDDRAYICRVRYTYTGGEFKDEEKPPMQRGRVYVTEDGKWSGYSFEKCLIKDAEDGYMPLDTIVLDCGELETSPGRWILTCNPTEALVDIDRSYGIVMDWIPAIEDKDIGDKEAWKAIEEWEDKGTKR